MESPLEIEAAESAAGTQPTDDDVRTCLRVLRAIEADRSHLTRLSREARRELLVLAGLIAKPERHDSCGWRRPFGVPTAKP